MAAHEDFGEQTPWITRDSSYLEPRPMESSNHTMLLREFGPTVEDAIRASLKKRKHLLERGSKAQVELETLLTHQLKQEVPAVLRIRPPSRLRLTDDEKQLLHMIEKQQLVAAIAKQEQEVRDIARGIVSMDEDIGETLRWAIGVSDKIYLNGSQKAFVDRLIDDGILVYKCRAGQQHSSLDCYQLLHLEPVSPKLSRSSSRPPTALSRPGSGAALGRTCSSATLCSRNLARLSSSNTFKGSL